MPPTVCRHILPKVKPHPHVFSASHSGRPSPPALHHSQWLLSTHTHPHSHTLSPSLPRTHQTPPTLLSLIDTHTLPHSLSLSLTRTHTHTHPPLPYSLTRTHTHTHTHTHRERERERES